jgi:hypothetical protein
VLPRPKSKSNNIYLFLIDKSAIEARYLARWFKLLPTFGGRVVTLADGLRLEGGELVMELQKTKVRMAAGGTADIWPSHG